jgi:hypothetical protein
MDPSTTDMEPTVTMILQGLAHLAVAPREAESPAAQARGAALRDLAPALAALLRALREHTQAQEAG